MVKTLKGKISLIYLCLVVMIAVVGAASVINLYGLSKSIDGLMTANYKSIHAVENMLEAVERQDSASLIYIYIDKQKGIDLFTENNNSFLRWYNTEANNITEQGEQALVANINGYYTTYVKLFSELQEIRNTKGIEASVEFYNSRIMPDFITVKQELKALSTLNEKAMFKSKDKATKTARTSMYWLLALSTVTIIGGFLMSRFFTHRFLRPIYTLTQTMKLVKAGDLNQEATIISQDEIGELAVEFNNMTKRLQQYEQSAIGRLMEEKNKSVAIVKSISDPLVVLDSHYRILLLNESCEKLFSVHETSAVNKHFLEVIRNGELFDYISGTFEAREGLKEKTISFLTEGEEYYFNVMVTTLKDMDTNLSGMIVVFHNITQLKYLEKVRTDFIATISHEFKTPLTSIIMGTDLILDEGMGLLNGDQRDVMNTIKEDSQRLSTLVHDLLELSKIESGKAIFHMEPCRIDGIIENSIKQFYPLAEQKDIQLNFECDEDLPKVDADPEKITWVLNNLISNALKYTNAGDEIHVSAAAQNGKMHITVKDTGAGIPEEYLDKIFDKFVQVKGYDLEMRGTGLGLAVVKEIIEAHHGEIKCESRLDSGSSFTFTLNLSKERSEKE